MAKDSLWNGIVIGALLGFLAPLVIVTLGVLLIYPSGFFQFVAESWRFLFEPIVLRVEIATTVIGAIMGLIIDKVK